MADDGGPCMTEPASLFPGLAEASGTGVLPSQVLRESFGGHMTQSIIGRGQQPRAAEYAGG